MFKRTILAVAATVALVGTTTTAAEAGTPSPIPPVWGGGTVTVDLPDFTFPAPSGCYAQTGKFSVTGSDSQYDDYDINIRALDPSGVVKASFAGTRAYAGDYDLTYQICAGAWSAGTYSVGGSFTFYDGSYNTTVYVSDTFTINPYVAPVVTPPAPPAPPKVSQKCVKAKAALKKAKKQHKPSKVIKAAQKKKNKVC